MTSLAIFVAWAFVAALVTALNLPERRRRNEERLGRGAERRAEQLIAEVRRDAAEHKKR